MKTILVTGATDGLGRAVAEQLLEQGHQVIAHGRSSSKLEALTKACAQYSEQLHTVNADFGDLRQVSALVDEVRLRFNHIDVLINNAGVFKTSALSAHPLDIRFVVNALAPYMLINGLVTLIPESGRIVNLSSAAQAPIDFAVLRKEKDQEDELNKYAQSKLALTCLTLAFAQKYANGPQFIAVNPGSLLATNMVREGFGVAGQDLHIGADILVKAAVGEEFANANGRYYDNDSQQFASAHAHAEDEEVQIKLMSTLAELVVEYES